MNPPNYHNENILQGIYNKLQGKENKDIRRTFRIRVIMDCDWNDDNMFYRKRAGLSALTKLEIKEISQIINELGIG